MALGVTVDAKRKKCRVYIHLRIYGVRHKEVVVLDAAHFSYLSFSDYFVYYFKLNYSFSSALPVCLRGRATGCTDSIETAAGGWWHTGLHIRVCL